MRSLDCKTQELLLAIARQKGALGVAPIAELAAEIPNWEETLRAARQHGVAPMLYSALIAHEESVSRDVLQLARSEFERNAFHCFANASELLAVLREFENAAIPAIPFKGVVLGASAYGDITARTAGDLDILIYYRDLRKGTEILKEHGYALTTKVLDDGSPEAEHCFEFHFERPSDGMVLELRWRLELIQPRFREKLGMDWVWPRRNSTKLAGADVPNLDAVSALLVLCMHGSKHVWARLIWICDVARLIESEPGLDWDAARKEAKRVGLWRCLALGVLLAQRVADAEVPQEVLESFRKDRVAMQLAEFFHEHAMDESHKMPAGRVPYNLHLLGFRDRAWAVLSGSALSPNERDRAFIRLPRALEPLYYLVRPIRILCDRSGR
jgi:hypothetical protein